MLAICAGSLFANATVQIIGNMNAQAMVPKTINIRYSARMAIYTYVYIYINIYTCVCVYVVTYI